MNYYVLQVAPREEEKTELHIQKILPADSYDQCFHLTRLMQKKFRGQWVKVQEKLLPGYVFVTAEDVSVFYQELKKIPLLTKVLGRDLECFVRLSEQEERWLDTLLGENRGPTINGRQKDRQMTAGKAGGEMHTVGLSQIDIQEGNEIRIVSGPLVDMEGMVKRINLHRMIAEVEVPFMNGSTVIHLGVEMVERKNA